MMQHVDRLREIARKAASQITHEDMEFIKALSADMGVEFYPKGRCRGCYSDQAVLLWSKVKNAEPSGNKEYILLDGIDVIFQGIRVNADTLTDEMAEDLIGRGFAKYLFAKCK